MPVPKKKTKKRILQEAPVVEDRVLDFSQVGLQGTSEEKWMKLNDVLKKMQIDRCELMFATESQMFIGPAQNSVLKAFY